jgi:hypothetical protein
MDMLSDRDSDGKHLDPKRDFEADYQRLNQEYDNLNRTMFERYIRYLDDSAVTRERKRKHDTALSAVDATNDTPLCPYTHIASLPAPPTTSPQWESITLTDTGNQALFIQGIHSEPHRSVSAIADSGASHVLLRASDSHILQNTEFSPSADKPYAVLKAANHAIITAIGRGILAVHNLAITAYIFADEDLANNLLGLIPFANFGCTTIFKPKSFHILPKDGGAPVLTGRRQCLLPMDSRAQQPAYDSRIGWHPASFQRDRELCRSQYGYHNS